MPKIFAPIRLENGEIYQETVSNKSSIGFYSSSGQNPVIASLGGNRNALYIYPKIMFQ
jgi:hypothetical protein